MSAIMSSNQLRILTVLVVLTMAPAVHAGPNEEAATAARKQAELRLFENLRASIVGGEQTLENRLADEQLRRPRERYLQSGKYVREKNLLAGLPEDLTKTIMTYLNPTELSSVACTNHELAGAARDPDVQTQVQNYHFNQLLGGFIELPAVTEADVAQLTAAGVQTSIGVMPRFKAAQAKTTIGLYRRIMGRYPDLMGCFSTQLGKQFTPENSAAMADQIRAWDQNPTLPLVCTTSADDVEFARRLSEITGRNFRIMRGDENEYMRRGRAIVEGQPKGDITTTPYFFGEDGNQVRNYGFISTNSGIRVQGVHENPLGFDPRQHRHPFGVKQPIGNVWERDAAGVIRGGAFNDYGEWFAKSSYSYGGRMHFRSGSIGSRLAEDIPAR